MTATQTPRKSIKADLIARLVEAGKGTKRGLRDVRIAVLQDMLAQVDTLPVPETHDVEDLPLPWQHPMGEVVAVEYPKDRPKVVDLVFADGLRTAETRHASYTLGADGVWDLTFEYVEPEGVTPKPEEVVNDLVLTGEGIEPKPEKKARKPRKPAAPKPEAKKAEPKKAKAEPKPKVDNDPELTREGINPDRLYTVQEIMVILGLSRHPIQRWFRLGMLANEEDPQAKRARQFHTSGATLTAFLAEREAQPEAEEGATDAA